MPSSLHDAVIDLFRVQPELGPALMREVFGLSLPEGPVRVQDSALSKNNPATLYPDLVLVIDAKGRRTTVVVEVQLRVDERKPVAWLCYLALLRQALGHDVIVLVVTLSARAERWAKRERDFGHPGLRFTPLVLGPDSIPGLSPEGSPERRLLAALAHAEQALSAEQAEALLRTCGSLDEGRKIQYLDLVLERADPTTRALLEQLMIQNYEFKSDFAKRYIAIGREEGREKGREEGREEGRGWEASSAVLRVLSARGLSVSPSQRERVLACRDLPTLERWLVAAATVSDASEFLAD